MVGNPGLGIVTGTRALVLIVVMILAGAVVYFYGTETRTMTIDFSYNGSTDSYFAGANLPLGVKGVRLHVEFAMSAIPKVTLKITDENGSPLKIVQGDLKFDATCFADIATWVEGFDGKQVNFALSFEPSVRTLSLPYLEVAYTPTPFG